MKKTLVYIISFLLFGFSTNIQAQTSVTDSLVTVPLNIRLGIDVSGPIIHALNKESVSYEGFASVDYNEKISFALNAGYAKNSISKYQYDYEASGIYFKPGIDYNILKPQLSQGAYWAGVGVRYGISAFSFESSNIKYSDIWGTTTFSLPSERRLAHFLEINSGFQANVTKHLTLGWRISLSKILYSGSKRDIKPIMIPGYGNRENGVSLGFKYYVGINISYKKIKAKYKEGDSGANYDTLEETDPNTESSRMF